MDSKQCGIEAGFVIDYEIIFNSGLDQEDKNIYLLVSYLYRKGIPITPRDRRQAFYTFQSQGQEARACVRSFVARTYRGHRPNTVHL